MRRSQILVAAALSAALAGCISVLPKAAPAQLYTFGEAMPAANAPTNQPRFAIEVLPITFDRAAGGDRILTMSGNEAAYIKGARWDTGAQYLFESALTNAFAADAGPARLIARGEQARPDYVLKLEVRTFEARYVGGRGAAPTAMVTVYAVLSKNGDRALTADRVFTASIPASENRVGAIASAYDQAVTQTLGQLARWVDAKGAG
ncbi:MAG TPA: ABC-type transport auxiliary lipoprotein family protein [Caulobacteraceae bacterium]|jgi:cholesterol transport system auxiliary component|nr:ABC-type transport auxiliary lipoprotein family protein [Caulobacteraceae bacterium]